MRYRHDLTEFVDFFGEWLQIHNLGAPGAYCRYAIPEDRDHGTQLDAYGCADAANILYMIGQFPSDPAERTQWIGTLQSFQRSQDGVFFNETHSDYHTTAHCTAALELFDARPRHPFHFLDDLLSQEGLFRFLDNLDWDSPWRASHDGAGCCAALAIADDVPRQWFDWYFTWLDREVDPETGFWRKDRLLPLSDRPGFFANLAGSFHYHFNYEYFREPMPHPEKVVDSCLRILAESSFPLAQTTVSFAEIDWIFCLSRALQQSGHRRTEALAALNEICDRTVAVLTNKDYLQGRVFDDLHGAFGAVCALAELQRILPGTLRTPCPLKLVLDRRPFI